MAETQKVTYSDKVHQEVVDVGGSLVADADPLVSTGLFGVNQLGFIFDFSSLYTSDSLGRPQEPPGIKANSLTLHVGSASVAEVTWRLYLVEEVNPVDFASALELSPPTSASSRAGRLVSTAAVPALAIDESFTFIFGSDYDGTSWTVNPEYADTLATLFSNYSSSLNKGKLAFVFRPDTGGSSSPGWHNSSNGTMSPSLDVDQWEFHTGHNKGRKGERAVRDMRTGRAVGAGELVEDGFLPGVWVSKDQVDPEDSRRTPPEPSDTERDRLDEVPT